MPRRLKRFIKRVLSPYSKDSFYNSLSDDVKILDVGCGNNSVRLVKEYKPNSYYVGVDIGDYNNNSESKKLMNEYRVLNPDSFAAELGSTGTDYDAVISAHNLEHCYEPYDVLKAMIGCLKNGGVLYLAFPSEKTVKLPSRGGCLNFYDDNTHRNVINWNELVCFLVDHNMTIEFASRNYSPSGLALIGKINERRSRKMNEVMIGTWAYYGFESIIWAKK